ncbi:MULTISPECIES: hypothetical protein [Enterobacteriaceae]|uniref:Uncharacterized protein n=2 Tax=Enterobacteriaceae TaxID=543 RepID=H5V6Y7_ATLHE|nr:MULTISPECIES: hypothetical protein [Enterobacteriaceae]MBZ3800043.1 hypothetical protein [Leclercia adecarboxylata]MBZ3804262.1 hypothetical protein [Leclercia adecarboxylata]MDU7814188.1 hypothetical protein [Atlantibacter hermannii]MEC3904460.1 hypothetical protein [Leclercia adecarboxylata]MEC3936313.1 hypothetical protein [Leclercia adecarboxylata]
MTSPFEDLRTDPYFCAWLAGLIGDEVQQQLQQAWRQLSEPSPEPLPAALPLSEPAAEPIPDALQPLRSIITMVKNDPELQEKWLRRPLPDDEAEQFQQVLVIASHWDRIERLWDVFAERVKTRAAPLNDAELHLMEYALSLHNRLWIDRLAELETVAAGSAYNYEIHNGVGQGDTIIALWLPGLMNSASKRVRKPLVQLS